VVNAVILILITLFLFFKSKKRNYTVDPELYPTMLVLVGATRFITEFFMDNEKIFLGCSGISFQCLLMWIVGASAIADIRRRNKSDATFTPNS
jgi:prolipoprotein diacylglyceryltransferase